MKTAITEYQKAEKFGDRLEKAFPWVLLVFFIGLFAGYGWAYKYFA